MSGYRFHFLFSFLMCLFLYLVVFYLDLIYFNILFISELFFVVFFFSLLPDIDSKKSYGSVLLHFFFILSIILFFSGFFEPEKGLTLICLLGFLEIYHFMFSRRGKNHRKFPHKLLFGLIISMIIGLIFWNSWFFVFGFLSFVSHIIIDKLW